MCNFEICKQCEEDIDPEQDVWGDEWNVFCSEECMEKRIEEVAQSRAYDKYMRMRGEE